MPAVTTHMHILSIETGPDPVSPCFCFGFTLFHPASVSVSKTICVGALCIMLGQGSRLLKHHPDLNVISLYIDYTPTSPDLWTPMLSVSCADKTMCVETFASLNTRCWLKPPVQFQPIGLVMQRVCISSTRSLKAMYTEDSVFKTLA